MTRKKYKTYSKEFKVEAIRLVEESDRPVAQIARELGIRQNQIYKWKEQLSDKGGTAFPGKGNISERDQENTRLRRELAKAKEEIEILKKASAYFAKHLE